MHEMRVTLRRLARAPGFTAVVVLTLALGVGVTTAVFSVAHAVVLAPLPFAEPDRLVRIWNHPQGDLETVVEASYPDYRTWSRESRSFAGVAGYASSSGGHLVDFGEGAREQVPGDIVSSNLFAVLGVAPRVGRPLSAADDRPGAEAVVVISEGLWRHRLGADPEVVGRRIKVDGAPRTVVAVMPATFEYPSGARLWLPVGTVIPEKFLANPHVRFFNLVARLGDGVLPAAAEEELNAVLDATTNPEMPPSARTEVTLAPLADELLGDTRGPLLLLLGAALLVLLLATANVANLELVRAVAGRRETAVRAALGAGLWHRVRGSLAESAVLAVAGGALGCGFAWLAVHRLMPLFPSAFFRGEQVGLDPPVLGFALAATATAILAFGLMPALLAGRRRIGAELQGGGGRTTADRGSRRLLAASVVAQVALALVLTVGAGILVRSFVRLAAVDVGFSRQGVLTQAVPLLGDEYDDPVRARQAYDAMVEEVAALPGVEAAAGVLVRPLDGPLGFDTAFTIQGRPAEEQASYPMLNLEAVTPAYFRTMGIALREGRVFSRADDADAPGVVLIGRSLADAYGHGESAVGQRLKWGGPESPAPWLEVVGVVDDVRHRAMRVGRLDVYVPHTQSPWNLNHLVVRTAGDPMAAASAVRGAIQRVDPDLQPMDVATTAQMVSRAVARPRFNAVLLGVFAVLALVLGAVGLYGVLSYIVALRRKEIGIRMAVGARPGQAAGLALGQALRLTLAGVALGVTASLWLGRALSGLLSGVLYEVAATDVATLATVPWLLLAVAMLAAAAPALRASRVDPGLVLREE